MQKARRHSYRAPTACRHTVSGSISLPSRGTFHLSLTVLFTIGHVRVFSLTGWSRRIQTEFHVYRPTWENINESNKFSDTGLSPSLARPFLIYSLNQYFFDSLEYLSIFITLPATPILLSWQAWHNIGLDYFHFARRYFGNHCCFLFLKVLRCFTSLRYQLLPYLFR